MLSVRRPQAANPTISYPLAVDGVEVSRPYRPVSPPKTPPRPRRGSASLSNPISWLARTSNLTSDKANGPHAASKPVRISEPQFTNALDLMISPRNGALGSGATVVRTPQDALARVFVDESAAFDECDFDEDSPVLPRDSRALPPLPLSYPAKRGLIQPAPPRATTAPEHRPFRSTPLASITIDEVVLQSSTSSKTIASITPPPAQDYFPPVPPLPAQIPALSTQAKLDPIIISPLVGPIIDRSKILVSLETSTTTNRTTLSTLLSRPSHLSQWLESAVKRATTSCGEDDMASLYSAESDSDASTFYSMFHNHLNNTGVLPAASSSMHIFLDRPSAPYTHIMTYLRSPVNGGVLPRAAQLTSASTARHEALLELRDEAAHLGLDELVKLCNDELLAKQRARVQVRATSSRPTSGFSGKTHIRTRSDDSVRSLATLVQSVTGHDEQQGSSESARVEHSASEVEFARVNPSPTPTSETIKAPRPSESSSVRSNKSLFELYERTPVASHFPVEHTPVSTPSVTSAPATPGPSPAARMVGLHRRMASRTQSENQEFNSMKTRPTAQWI